MPVVFVMRRLIWYDVVPLKGRPILMGSDSGLLVDLGGDGLREVSMTLLTTVDGKLLWEMKTFCRCWISGSGSEEMLMARLVSVGIMPVLVQKGWLDL